MGLKQNKGGKRKVMYVLIIFITIMIVMVFVIDKIVSLKTKDYIFDDVDKIPANRVGVVLGTSKKLKNGNNNYYFIYRIQAAKKLYDAGKVSFFIVSGDNSSKEYNEPQDMKDDLVLAGITQDSIYLDYAGFRTLDSVIRTKDVFGQNTFTLISQKFHNERAVFLAQQYGLNAIGYNAKDVNAYYGFKTMAREKLARVKLLLDLLVNKKPKYGGEKIELP
ncbi:ElyC/SanA/YdcF family protein [Apibacter raozihei]|uniref:SanA/YdcF family protein n=1 Tax=Apibacter raozihei TaxID=2500547 RepID=UPI0015F2D444|nr:ElyC/SanA/YdcF family protein [Apibacter raozihei]